MNKSFKLPIYIIVATLISVALISFVILKTNALAQTEITFPVAELGGCEDEKACKSYCDNPNNFASCFAFAKKHNLVKEIKGRGGEKTSDEEIEKFAKAMKGGGGPGGCQNHGECEAFCSNIDNMETCINWAEQNGVMRGSELEEAKKVRSAMQRGAKMPGNCKSKDQCESYCQNPDHMEECLAFAEEAGFIPKEELEQAKKFMQHMKEGKTPGGCRSEQECETYCFEGDHIEECMSFAEKNGLASKEEIEMFKKTGGKGPGGCRGRECETFCNQEENQETCFSWAKENGMMKQEDLQRMEEGKKQFKNSLKQMPPEVLQCLKESIGSDKWAQIESGEKMPSRNIGEKMQQCFEKTFSQGGFPGGPEGMMPDGIPRGQEGFGPRGGGGADSFPSEVKHCLLEKVGEEGLRSLQSGGPSPELQSAMQECFGKQQGENRGPQQGNLEHRPDDKFCKENPEKCKGQFHGQGATEGQFPGQGATEGNFPGRGFDENFCKENPEKCQGIPTEGDHQTPFPGQYPNPSGEGTYPSSGTEQYKQQYNEEYQKQYQQQYPSGGTYPSTYPTGDINQYPTGTTYPSDGTTYPTGGTYDQNYQQPAPTNEPAPAPSPSLNPPKLGEFFLGMLINLLY